MRRDPHETVAEPSFGPTSGVVSGVFGEVVAVVIGLAAAFGQHTLGGVRVILAAVLGGVLVWAFLLRSRIVLRREGVLLRNAFADTLVPYGLIDAVVIRTVTHLVVGSQRYVGAGVGRSVRQLVRGRTAPAAPELATKRSSVDLPDFMEERILERIREARQQAGVPTAPVVRRTPAWPEIAGTVVSAAALAVTFVV